MQIATTHKNTDFDALASVIAATILYPDSMAALPKAVNPNVKEFLSIHKDIFRIIDTDEINFAEVKRLIVVDTNRWDRLQGFSALKDRNDLEIILWDHHTQEGDIAATWEHCEPMGSNVGLMVNEIKNRNIELTPIQSTLFLAGIYEDTGNLMFPSTKAEDAYAAAYLLSHKADLNILSSFLRPAYGVRQKEMLFQMLQSAERKKLNGFTVSVNRQTIENHVGSLSVVVQMYREILNVDAAFGIFTDPARGNSIVIGRSNVDEMNIGAIMRGLGGGGHTGAGSALLKSATPDAIEELILEMAGGNQYASVQISDLMSFPVYRISADISMEQAFTELVENGFSGAPVMDGERLLGVISRRDFRKIKRKSGRKAPVKAYMSNKLLTIEPGASPLNAVRLMIKHDVGRLPVVENGRVIGLVSRSDLMCYFYDLLPG